MVRVGDGGRYLLRIVGRAHTFFFRAAGANTARTRKAHIPQPSPRIVSLGVCRGTDGERWWEDLRIAGGGRSERTWTSAVCLRLPRSYFDLLLLSPHRPLLDASGTGQREGGGGVYHPFRGGHRGQAVQRRRVWSEIWSWGFRRRLREALPGPLMVESGSPRGMVARRGTLALLMVPTQYNHRPLTKQRGSWIGAALGSLIQVCSDGNATRSAGKVPHLVTNGGANLNSACPYEQPVSGRPAG